MELQIKRWLKKIQAGAELRSLFNCITSTAKLPEEWKLANVAVVDKDNGDAKYAPN